MREHIKAIKDLFSVSRILGFKKIILMNRTHNLSLKYIRAYFITECFKSLFEIGFFDTLKTKKQINIKEFSSAHGIDYSYLRVICDYLYAVKIMNKSKDGLCSLSNNADFIINYAQGPFYFVNAYSPVVENMSALLNKTKAYGKDIFRNEFFVSKASAETEQWVPYPVVTDLVKRFKVKSILDLGCGSGEFLIKLGLDNPLIICHGIDISSVSIKAGNSKLKSFPESVRKRINLSVLNIFQIKDFDKTRADSLDVVISMFVLHEFLAGGDEKIMALLDDLRKTFKNSYFIICELCRNSPDELRKKQNLISEHHLFHALSNQRLLSRNEWWAIFTNAGFKIVEEINFNPASQSCFLLK